MHVEMSLHQVVTTYILHFCLLLYMTDKKSVNSASVSMNEKSLIKGKRMEFLKNTTNQFLYTVVSPLEGAP